MSVALRSWVGRKGFCATLLALMVLSGCGGSDPVQVDSGVAAFVGDWVADALVVTSVANPDIHPDLIAIGASFTLNVQDSGQYTAILIYAGQAQTEIGTVEVSGRTVTLKRDFPSRATSSSTFSFQGSDQFAMDGDTQFDFNLDGQAEAARAHVEFHRK